MARGVRWYLVGSLVLVALAGCGRVWLAERDSWRNEAEVACLKSGSVKEGPAIARIRPIQGPGVCGANHPLKVVAIGEMTALGYVEEMRPPGAIPGGYPAPAPRATYAPAPYGQPAQPAYYPPPSAPPAYPPNPQYGREPGPAAPSSYPGPAARPSPGPMSIVPPGVEEPDVDTPGTYASPPPGYGAPQPGPGAPQADPRQPSWGAQPYPQRAPTYGAPPPAYPSDPYGRQPTYPQAAPAAAETVPLGPNRTPLAAGPATVQPAATLACPIVSRLDRWIAEGVQPAAMRWLGQPVAEIKQISAYSCRSMNGQRGAPISEHAFGNALDIAAFTLADGRKVTVKDGWRGVPEEQGFLRDVHASACQMFSTVLAPGSNMFHYDHIHVDLARRASGRAICNPAPIPGDVVAGRLGGTPFARRGDPAFTGSVKRPAPAGRRRDVVDDSLPRAVPGED